MSVYEDDFLKVGKRFGMLTYTGEWNTRQYRKWFKLICDCGNEVWKRRDALQLKNAGVFGCGCGVKGENVRRYGKPRNFDKSNNKKRVRANKFIDETGNKHHRLTVIKRAKNAKNGHTSWLCRCDCGKETIVTGSHLRIGHTKSCGCYNRDRVKQCNSLPEGVAAFNRLYEVYIKGAKRRNHNFNLSKKEFKTLTSGNCYYCDSPPTYIKSDKYCNGVYIYNGIDRLDNEKGYTVDNCVTSCIQCNYMKRKLSLKEFKEHLKKLCNNINNW